MKNYNLFKFSLLVLVSLSISQIKAQENDSIRYNAYGQKVDRIPLSAESRNGILVFESKDQKIKTWFDLRVNFDGAYYFDENSLNPKGNGTTIRRLRFAMKSFLYDHWTGEVDLNFSGGQLDVKDAFIGYMMKKEKMYFKAGYFKEPISMETTTTSRYQTFIEEPFLTEFAPARQLGINASKWDKMYLCFLGVHFQDVENLEVTTYTQNVNKASGTDEGYSITGKAVFRPINNDYSVIHLGFAGSYRTPKTSWEFPKTYRISMRDMTNISRLKFLDSDDIPNVKNHNILAGEFAAYYKNFKFSSEYIQTTINRETGFEKYTAKGFYAGVAWLIFGGKYNYDDAEGEFNQISRGKKWGDIELALRYDFIDLNDSNAKIMGGSANGYTAGITYHVNPNVKFMLNYSYIDHDRYASGKGKLFVGTDANGQPTKDYSKVTESAKNAGDDYGFIQVRFEIDF